MQGIFHLHRADAGVFADLTTCCAQVTFLRVASGIDTSCCKAYFWSKRMGEDSECGRLAKLKANDRRLARRRVESG